VLSDRRASFLTVLGRLRPGVTLATARAQLSTLSSELRHEAPLSEVDHNLNVIPIWQSPFGAQTYMLPAVTVMAAMGALLLLLVCANLAGLVLVRGVSRRGEIAVRLALGANRVRILRLLLVENLVLAVPGALFGLALVWFVMPLFMKGLPSAARMVFDLAIDWLVVAFSVTAACVSAVAFGFVPALRASRVDLASVVNEDSSPRGGARGRFREGLVVSQVAVSMLLLVGSGLVARSLQAARTADAGFDATNVIAVQVEVKPNGYDEARGRVFFRQLVDAIRADQNVESATLAAYTPLTVVDSGRQAVSIEGYEPRRGEDLTFLWNTVGPDYFRTLRIGLAAGREFESQDDAAAAQVAIVNETMARRFWGGPTQAIGKRVRLSAGAWRSVIGVAQDVKYARINEEPRPYVYVPFLQSYRSSMILHSRGPAGVGTLLEQARAHIRALDADLPVFFANSLSEQTGWSLSILQMTATALFAFGVAGMALAALGIYGLVSYSVSQTTHEIGIRMALGAQGFALVRGFLGRGLRLGVIGAALGIVAALAVTRFLGSLLYGVTGTDPVSFARALAVVLGAVLVATFVPAWRAARTSPLTALRRS
jgi:predicted permease